MTLICFGAAANVELRFKRLTLHHSWADALEDPYVLFDIVMDELYLQMDGVAWTLGEVFGGIENASVSITLLSS